MIEMFMSNLWIFAPALWVCFIVYAAWYFTKVKTFAPITCAEARQLWAIHQKNTGCSNKKWRQIKHHDTTVGFECGCGYRHLHKRPVVGHSPPKSVSLKTPSFNTLRPSDR